MIRRQDYYWCKKATNNIIWVEKRCTAKVIGFCPMETLKNLHLLRSWYVIFIRFDVLTCVNLFHSQGCKFTVILPLAFSIRSNSMSRWVGVFSFFKNESVYLTNISFRKVEHIILLEFLKSEKLMVFKRRKKPCSPIYNFKILIFVNCVKTSNKNY